MNDNKDEIQALQKKLRYLTWYMRHNVSQKEEILWLKRVFYSRLGYMPDLKNPKTYNEKVNWYRYFYNDPQIPSLIDKVSFKDYVREKLGDGYTAKLYDVWEDETDVDFNKLPDQFVIKSNLFGLCQTCKNY